MEHTPPAILLGGRASSLSVARSLGRAGVEAIVVSDAATSPARFSRHCSSFVDVGSGDGLAERWLAYLDEGPAGAVVLACTDEAVVLIANNRARIESRPYIVNAMNDEVALAMLDKERTYRLAREIGVVVPETRMITTVDELREAAREIGYPCGLKPRHAHQFRKRFGLTTKLFVLHADEDVERIGSELLETELEMIVTELIPGPDSELWGYITYIRPDGEPLFDYTKRKLRQYPPEFGIGCYVESRWEPDVARIGLEFLQGVGLRGYAGVELKRDARDGRFVLIECNHRFLNDTPLIPAAGIDAGLLVYDHLIGRPSAAKNGPYRDGVRLLAFMDDLRTFRIERARGRMTFRRWFSSLLHPQHFPVLSLEDPRPSLMTNALALRKLLRRVLRR